MKRSETAVKESMALTILWRDRFISGDVNELEILLDSDGVVLAYPSDPRIFYKTLRRLIDGMISMDYWCVVGDDKWKPVGHPAEALGVKLLPVQDKLISARYIMTKRRPVNYKRLSEVELLARLAWYVTQSRLFENG